MRKRLLTDAQVELVKKRILAGSTKVEMAREYGVSPQLISVVCKFGYGERPKYGYKKHLPKPRDRDCWEVVAQKYTEANPNDPIKATTARKTHDAALAKLRKILELNYGFSAKRYRAGDCDL